MKKIFLIGLLVFPTFAFGQSISFDDIDFDRILSCDHGDLACEADLVMTRLLVQELLTQIVAAQLADNSDAYWLDRSYLEELEDNPLDEGRKKTFRIVGQK